MRTNLAPLVLLALASSVRSEVHTVGPPGSGADFTSIQAAIDAAAAGDTVLVAAGDYTGFSLEKPLLVIGAGSGQTKVTAAYPFGTAVTVIDVPAEKVAAVAGMAFEPAPLGFIGGGGIELPPSAGTVVLHDVRNASEDFGDVHADLVGRLVVSRLSLATGGNGKPALFAAGSRVWLVDSDFEMAKTIMSGWPALIYTARLVDSEATFAGCTLLGAGVDPTWSAWGGNAVDLKGSQVVASRTVLRGGNASTTGEGGYGAALVTASTLLATADARVKGGLDGAGLVEQAAVSVEAGSAFVQGPGVLPTLSASPAIAMAGDSLALELYGEPGASGALFVSLAPGAGATIPGLAGEVFLDLAAPIALGAVNLDGGGKAHLSLTVPALAEPALVTFQWAALSSAVLVSNPAFVGVE